MNLSELLAVARGERPADLLLDNLRLLDVFSGAVEDTAVAIAGDRIAGLGQDYEATRRVDLDGRFLAPGLVDAHVHIESALVAPRQFARAVVPRGVTTVITDPHEIANVCGLEGIRFMLEDATAVPLEVFVNASSCVPATHLATAGAELGAAELATLLDEPRVLGLAEVMNYPGVVAGDPAVMAKLEAFRGRVLDGHAPGLTGRALNAYVAAGISSDHECTTLAEAREKLSRGLTIFLREATNARNLEDLLPLVDATTERRLCLATDDRQPADLLDDGSIDHMVRIAVRHGVEPVTAIRMATLNPAEHYRLTDRGAVAPGRRADLVVVSDLRDFRPEMVWIGGQQVAEDGAVRFEVGPATVDRLGGVRVDASSLDLRVPARGDRMRVIEVIPDQLVTRSRTLSPTLDSGLAVADPDRDLLKVAVVERHRGTGRVGVGFVAGVGLSRGAIAGTFAHDHHNLVIVGADDTSMRTAAEAVAGAGGGLAAASGADVLEVLPLPLGGLMSDRPVEEVRRAMDRLLVAGRRLGSSLHDPFMAMSFLTLEVIPTLKITDLGLVDVERFEVVELFLGS